MLEAFWWGFLGASALLIGCLLAIRFSFSKRFVGLIMAFAAGVLISAVAYELVQVSIEEYNPAGAAIGLFAGAGTFFLGDLLIAKRTGPEGGGAMPIVLGTILDGVPESVVLGLTVIQGDVGVTFLVAVWLSNLPEALVSTEGLKGAGWSVRNLFVLWGGVVLVSALAAAIGFVALDGASDATVAFFFAFAGGAILTMLADSMMPEAFEDAGPLVGLVTTFGFATAYVIQSLE